MLCMEPGSERGTDSPGEDEVLVGDGQSCQHAGIFASRNSLIDCFSQVARVIRGQRDNSIESRVVLIDLRKMGIQ